MTIEATAEALAPETVPAQPIDAPQEEGPSEQDELNAIWDKAQETQDQTPDEPVEEAKVDEQPAEEPETVEIPSEVPKALKEHWRDIPESARSQMQAWVQEQNRKLAEQGRMVQGISPIRDVLVEATQKLPQLAGMKPQDVAKEVMQLAEVSAQFQADPVKTMLGLIEKHGVKEQMAQALSGQPIQSGEAINRLMQENQRLQREIAQIKDPDYIRSQVTAITTEQTVQSDVQKFAAEAPHWDDVENEMPMFVEFIRGRMGQDASTKDVLKAAYDLAVREIVPEDRKALTQATDPVADTVDPEKAKAVLKAKSVNVSGKPSKPRTLSAEEELAQVYDAMQKK